MLSLGGKPFTTGRVEFFDRFTGSRELTAKIYINVKFGGVETTFLAQLDTGAAWSMLSREVAEELGLFDGEGEEITVSTRLGRVRGRLERLMMKIVAKEGQSLEFEATFFVSRDWQDTVFLGYSGLLDRLKIGIDPSSNSLFFGLIASEA